MEASEETEIQLRDLEARAEALAQAGNPELAEGRFLTALKVREQLLAATGDPKQARAARELCESLADVCMQQGNLHGADFYYARAMGYGQGLRFP